MSNDGKENPTLTPTPSTLLKTQKRKAMDVETQENVTLDNKDDQSPSPPLPPLLIHVVPTELPVPTYP